MTVAELIEHLSKMSPELSVYRVDKKGDWVPLRKEKVHCQRFEGEFSAFERVHIGDKMTIGS